MKIYITSRGDEVFLDDGDYSELIVGKSYTYYVDRNKYKNIVNARRAIPALLSGTRKQKIQLIHWDVMGHPGKGMVMDHIDGNPLNNQRNNLRICSYRENNQNLRHKSATRKYSSKYPGVCWNKSSEKWQAQIRINKKLKHLGFFLNEENAARAYQNVYNTLNISEI